MSATLSETPHHRKAYGAHRAISAQTKARNVAASITAHQLPLTYETWTRYGLQHNAAQQALVLAALTGQAVRP